MSLLGCPDIESTDSMLLDWVTVIRKASCFLELGIVDRDSVRTHWKVRALRRIHRDGVGSENRVAPLRLTRFGV